MQKKHFYSDIVETSSLSLALGNLDLTLDERKELIGLVEINLHKIIMDLVLSELSEDDKKQFLLHIASDHHEKTWHLLKTKIDHIEEKIQKAAKDLEKQLHEDIKEAKKKQ